MTSRSGLGILVFLGWNVLFSSTFEKWPDSNYLQVYHRSMQKICTAEIFLRVVIIRFPVSVILNVLAHLSQVLYQIEYRSPGYSQSLCQLIRCASCLKTDELLEAFDSLEVADKTHKFRGLDFMTAYKIECN